MAGALDGVRVLDLTRGPAGGVATMILSDFGADVLMIERPGDDPMLALPASRMWRRGKRSLTLDLSSDEGLSTLDDLCAGADVLVCNWRSSALVKKRLDFANLHPRHPHLILCHISGYGSEGPRADYPGYEHLVAASTGRMRMFSGLVDRAGPVFSALQVGVHACAQSAAAGILAALLEQGGDGEGRLVETSMLRSMLPHELAALIGAQFPEFFGDFIPAVPPAVIEPPIPSLFYHPAQTSDGRWVQFGNLLPHLFDNFLLVTELIDVLADPDYDQEQMMLPDEKQEAFRERMLTRIQERTADEWIAACVADGGVVATAHQTTQQALADPDIVANGHVIDRPDGGKQLGPLARMMRTPAIPGSDAIPDDSWANLWRNTPRDSPSRSNDLQLPLAGLRVVEIATIIAAPLATSVLADMGADVTKIEPIGGDPFRGLLGGLGSAKVNAGKRSLCIDLKSESGRDIVLGLIKDADVLIHNFRPGVPERLGIGYPQVEKINPGIVYLQANGYGPDGPGAQRPSTHPIPGAAMGGVLYQMGERVPEALLDIDDLRIWTRRLMHANEVNPDPNTALVIATSVMLGLVARQRTGQGQQILVDMFGANAYANSDDFLSYPGKPGRAMPDAELLGLSATYRLYPCTGDEWVFLAMTCETEYRLFIDTLTVAGMQAPTVEMLQAGGEAASKALGTLFVQQDSAFWENLLGSAGVGCVRANALTPREFWLTDPQSIALGLTAETEHPMWGTYRRHGCLVLFDGGGQELGPPPLAGQHNTAVLLERGFDEEQIARLKSDGVLWSEVD
jgi:crotonobetainyl-CoA:carnitine CoA-transferase CaiB-like acyl-CoA transferase